MRLFTIIFLFVSSMAYSQNWDLYPLNQRSYYLHSKDSTIHGLIADSVKVYSDDHKVAFLNSKIFPCVQELKSSVLYSKPHHYIDSLVVKFDTVFISLEGVTKPFIFLPKAKKGTSWNVFQKNDFYVDIECTEENKELIFDELDSVKVFSVKSYVALENTIVTTSLLSIFKLSKKFGLIQYIPFNEFVDVSTSTDFTEMKLFGLDNGSPKGYKLPGLHDYFKLNEGDVLLWKYYSEYIDIVYGSNTNDYKYYRDSITEVNKEDSYIAYVYDRLTVLSNGDQSEKIGLNDTFALSNWGKHISSFPDWYYLHAESEGSFENLWYPIYKVSISGDDTITYLKILTSGHYMEKDNCEINYIADVSKSVKINTLAGAEEYYFFNFNSITQSLIGSKISGKVTGNIDIITNVKDKVVVKKINVFPNPAMNVLNVEIDSNIQCEYKILSALGTVVQEGVLFPGPLDVSALPEGIYYLTIKENNLMYTATFAKE
ncbi:MAG TPA: T9SS type A sorting domain-containing protein [Cytophagaceae bacterium]